MKIFNYFDLQCFLKKAQKSRDGWAYVVARLRFCKACVRVKYFEKDNNFLVILQSYARKAMTLTCDSCGRVLWAEFSPYWFMTTGQHIRKFCALFQNGRELYCAYSEAAYGGKQEIFFE